MLQSSCWQRLRQWLLLSFQPGIGSKRLVALVNRFGSAEGVFAASPDELSEGLPRELAARLGNRKRESGDIPLLLDGCQRWLESSEQHHILTLDSASYPPMLKTIADPPPILYAIGNINLLSEPQLAIVGSRRPTRQGQQLACDMARRLTDSGLLVTSGMAMGIDAWAHHGALAEGGQTIAVLGTGVDIAYPRNNRGLYHRIIDQGVLISEFPLGTAASPGHFPRRNRIVAGISLGVLVIEAALNSGSLVSARLAVEQGREVFAVPGLVSSPLSRGCHKLIREGAVLVESIEDILAELKYTLRPITEDKTDQVMPVFDDSWRRVLAAMGTEIIDVDTLSSLSGLPCDQLSVLLTELEMEGLVSLVPGGFIKTGM